MTTSAKPISSETELPNPDAIRRYVRRESDPTEEERIELALLDQPRLLDAVIAEQLLIEGTPLLDSAYAQPPTHRLRAARTIPLAWAASVLLGLSTATCAVGWYFGQREGTSSSQDISVAILAPMRGASEAQIVRRIPTDSPLLLAIPVATAESDYSVTVQADDGGSPPRLFSPVRASGELKLLTLLLPARDLPNGAYTVVVRNNGEIVKLQIRVQ